VKGFEEALYSSSVENGRFGRWCNALEMLTVNEIYHLIAKEYVHVTSEW
jgi:hypothetical protein